MISELLRDRLKDSVGKTVLIFLENSFRYEGKITGCDSEFLAIFDFRKSSEKFIKLNEISEVEIK